MADIFTKKKRSEIMGRIKSKNTNIERAVFSLLHKNKIYFQKHYKKILGTPDIALPSKKIAIFIDGDFWYGYCYSEWKSRLTNKFWTDKIERNMGRDEKYRRILRQHGWKVMSIWEHEIIKNPDVTLTKKGNIIIQKIENKFL